MGWGLGVGSWQYPVARAKHGMAALRPSRAQLLHREQSPRQRHCWWILLNAFANIWQFHTTGFESRVGNEKRREQQEQSLLTKKSAALAKKDHPQASRALMTACRP